jgi:hypothetical protein
MDTAGRRLHVYLQQTMPLVEQYRQLGLLHEVDGAGEVPEVARRILHAIHGCSAQYRQPVGARQHVAARGAATMG